MRISSKRIREFQKTLFQWWAKNKRDLPWRHTRDPYNIVVSEVMLQQTQVLRVITKYREFIERYPTVGDLAEASPGDVLRMWKGLGYNRRALYLRRMAQIIVATYHGKFPKSEKLLVELPGVGIYTARALLVFAYEEEVACVDTNIRKIITHFFFNDIPQRPSIIQSVADQLVPRGKSWEWHQALMDFGALRLSLELTPSKRSVQASRKKSIPFKETNRFYRGEIIDMLREKKYIETKIINYIYNRYNKQEYEIQNIINSLIKDGLVTRKKNILSLPG
jgi:A/G-specific adenine glycosylase